MAATILSINGGEYEVDVSPDMPLLWVLRDVMGLTGTKYGCGVGLCGACTVHIDGEAVHSCTQSASAAVGKAITPIEGLGTTSGRTLQQAWIDHRVPQCGYCQTGQLMATPAVLNALSMASGKRIRNLPIRPDELRVA